MAQYFSESHEGMSSLPTNSHGGMLMRHRCAIAFVVGGTLAAKDQLVLGVLPAGYTIDEITADSDGIAGLKVNVVQAEGLAESDAKTTLASAISLATAGGVAGTVTKDAIRFKGTDKGLYLVAEVVEGGNVTAGQEVGVTFTYRYRQVTY
ncbi:hypothetical protein [Acinetobacter sp. NS4_7]